MNINPIKNKANNWIRIKVIGPDNASTKSSNMV